MIYKIYQKKMHRTDVMQFIMLVMIIKLPLLYTSIYFNSTLIFSPPFWKHQKGLQRSKLGDGWDVETVKCQDEQKLDKAVMRFKT